MISFKCLNPVIGFIEAKDNCSIVSHAEESSTSTDPVIFSCVSGEVEVHHEIGRVTCGGQFSLSFRCLVNGAFVSALVLDFVSHHRFKPDGGEISDGLSVFHLVDEFLFVFPSCSLEEHTVAVHTSLGLFFDSISITCHDMSLETEFINFKQVCTGMHLKLSCFETLREEEPGNPVSIGGSLFDPVSHKGNSLT
jgi:hypothetical protein